MLKKIGFIALFMCSLQVMAQSVYPNSGSGGITGAGDNPTKNRKSLRPGDILWLAPETRNIGVQYERIELAVDLPQKVKERILYFLATDDSIKGVNPFLEWQLDVTATFTHVQSQTVRTVDAFYYHNYERDTSNADFRKWKWNKKETPNFMRVRFAPPLPGDWVCNISVKTKKTNFKYPPFYFKVARSNNPGYVAMGESKRYFTLGEETYFPAGQNLVSPRCEFCFVNTRMDLPGPKNGPAAQSLESWMLEPTVVKGFIMFQDHMKSLAASGGNYFREILIPQNQDIEWEKLGNYYDRMNRAWELDEQVFLAEDLGLKMQLNLQIQFSLENDQNRIFWNWSTDKGDKRHRSPKTPCANPYNTQIKTTRNDDPNTFFSDPTARKFYRQKLRYIVSRWGYSTGIAVFGMASEIETPCTDPPVCVSWMTEMGAYMKEDLKINQLLSPSFLGIYHDAENYENKIMELENYDMSTYNWYSASPTKFQGVLQHIEGLNNQFDKPFFFGEMGNADLYPCDTSRIEWIRDSWLSAFSGNAGIGMNWDDPFDDELRAHLGNIHGFVHGIDFDNEGDPWKTQRVVSDNRKAETVFLISPEKTHAVGVISNRYYNWYLNGDTTVNRNGRLICADRIPTDPGFDHTRPPAERGIWERNYNDSPDNYIDQFSRKSEMNNPVVFSPFQTISSDSDKHNRLRIYGLNGGVYTVDFYNALTMEYLGSQTNRGPSVRLEYPEMDINTGLIAFKLRQNKEGDFPQIQEEDRVLIDHKAAIYNQAANGFLIANNRYSIEYNNETASGTVDILHSGEKRDYELMIYDAKGQLILTERSDDPSFAFSNLPAGQLHIKLFVNGFCYTEDIEHKPKF